MSISIGSSAMTGISTDYANKKPEEAAASAVAGAAAKVAHNKRGGRGHRHHGVASAMTGAAVKTGEAAAKTGATEKTETAAKTGADAAQKNPSKGVDMFV
jgi:hypothetical protein